MRFPKPAGGALGLTGSTLVATASPLTVKSSTGHFKELRWRRKAPPPRLNGCLEGGTGQVGQRHDSRRFVESLKQGDVAWRLGLETGTGEAQEAQEDLQVHTLGPCRLKEMVVV